MNTEEMDADDLSAAQLIREVHAGWLRFWRKRGVKPPPISESFLDGGYYKYAYRDDDNGNADGYKVLMPSMDLPE